MINAIKDLLDLLFYPITSEGKRERYHREMNDFLSQATDAVHLEYLQKEWDKHHGYRSY